MNKDTHVALLGGAIHNFFYIFSNFSDNLNGFLHKDNNALAHVYAAHFVNVTGLIMLCHHIVLQIDNTE